MQRYTNLFYYELGNRLGHTGEYTNELDYDKMVPVECFKIGVRAHCDYEWVDLILDDCIVGNCGSYDYALKKYKELPEDPDTLYRRFVKTDKDLVKRLVTILKDYKAQLALEMEA